MAFLKFGLVSVWFLRATAVPAGTAEWILAMVNVHVTTQYRFKPG